MPPGAACRPMEVTDFKAVFGKGIEGRYAQELYFAGNEAMLAERGMALPRPVKQKLDALAGEGEDPAAVLRRKDGAWRYRRSGHRQAFQRRSHCGLKAYGH